MQAAPELLELLLAAQATTDVGRAHSASREMPMELLDRNQQVHEPAAEVALGSNHLVLCHQLRVLFTTILLTLTREEQRR